MSFLIVFLLVSMFLIFIKSQISNIVISKVCNYSLITSVLDTNVYNPSNTLSCKIDKTAPTVTCSYNGGASDYWIFYDNLSGCTEFTLTDVRHDISSDRCIIDGTTYSGNVSARTKLKTKEVRTTNSNFQIYWNGTSNPAYNYGYATLTIFDTAGNSMSKKAGGYYYWNGSRYTSYHGY